MKALFPIDVTELGIVISDKLLQSRNASYLISFTVLGIVIFDKLLHSANVLYSIDVMGPKIVTEVNFVHPSKAY
jgi:hypothetical protein